MIDGLKPYPEYKESGQKWVGTVPTHWDILPNRAIFQEVKERGHPDEEMLSVTIKQGVILQKTLLSDSSKKDSSNLNKQAYKLVCPNDIAYNKMRAWQGAIGVSNFRGIVSPAYVIMRLRKKLNPRYFHFLFRTPHFAKEAERWSYGITSDMWSLRPEHFKMIYTPLPPKDEQAAIVKLLNHATSKLNRAIRAKKKVIALLNEQKQVIIHRAVTRGLDPNVQLKPSGIPWLVEIPKHWEVKPVLGLFEERKERGRLGLPVLIVSLRTGVTVGKDQDEKGRPRRLISDITAYKFTDVGDIVYNMMRMWQGAVGTVKTAGLVSPAYIVARPYDGVIADFYELIFRTEAFMNEVNRNSRGIVSDRNRLYWDQFKRLKLPLPSSKEQKSIVRWLNLELAVTNKAISNTEHQIILLREFRTRLIADVVTGKLDIREAARDISVEPDEIEPDIESTDAPEDDSQESETTREAYG